MFQTKNNRKHKQEPTSFPMLALVRGKRKIMFVGDDDPGVPFSWTIENEKLKIRVSKNHVIPSLRNEGVPAKANGFCGERRSQDTAGIFRLRKMQHCILCFDDVSIRFDLPFLFRQERKQRSRLKGRYGKMRPLKNPPPPYRNLSYNIRLAFYKFFVGASITRPPISIRRRR